MLVYKKKQKGIHQCKSRMCWGYETVVRGLCVCAHRRGRESLLVPRSLIVAEDDLIHFEDGLHCDALELHVRHLALDALWSHDGGRKDNSEVEWRHLGRRYFAFESRSENLLTKLCFSWAITLARWNTRNSRQSLWLFGS